jgi:mortality factor 4-like protein 1
LLACASTLKGRCLASFSTGELASLTANPSQPVSAANSLLRRFERPQWHDVKKSWEEPGWSGEKSVCATYGAEHLCRLIGRLHHVSRSMIEFLLISSRHVVSLEELVVQTNLDQASCNKLREELSQFTVWLGKHMTKYFINEYSSPTQEYVERTRF